LSIWSISQAVCSVSASQRLVLAVQLGEAELDRLVARQGLAEGVALPGVAHALLDAVARRAQARGGLADAVLVDEVLGDGQAPLRLAEHALVRQPHIPEATRG
jgi:hypothetical protein